MKLEINKKIGVKEYDFLVELQNLMKKYVATFDVSIERIDYECCMACFTYDIEGSSTGNTLLLDITSSRELDSETIDKLLHSYKLRT